MADERTRILAEIEENLRRLKAAGFAGLIPEVGSNLAFATKNARSFEDVAAVPGRIRNAMGEPAFLKPRFGASRHVASVILAAMKYNPGVRSAVNIRYSERIVEALKTSGLEVVFVDRMSEPESVKHEEGSSIPWVFRKAYRKCGCVPDVIYHRGSVGREAIVTILGGNPGEVIDITVRLLGSIKKGSGNLLCTKN